MLQIINTMAVVELRYVRNGMNMKHSVLGHFKTDMIQMLHMDNAL